ncbi:PREDICTED: uncharacterized protein LOC106297110 [Brassica oleracea var. oleracea]|nr:PREDICTED: uncharacterized protein LOC106297110 [Brassica oleracea var. oleracea]
MRSLRIHPLVASTSVKGFLQSFEDLGYMSRKQEYEFGWKKTKTKFMAWRKTTTVKRRSCGEGGAEAEVEARHTRLGQALCWLHLLSTITDPRSSSDETGKISSGVTESVSG